MSFLPSFNDCAFCGLNHTVETCWKLGSQIRKLPKCKGATPFDREAVNSVNDQPITDEVWEEHSEAIKTWIRKATERLQKTRKEKLEGQRERITSR